MDVYISDQLLQVQCCGLKKSLFVLLPPWVGFSVGSGLVCPVKKYDLWAPPPYSVLPSTHSFPSYCAQIDMIVTNCDSAIVMATVTKLIPFQTLCSIVCAFSGDQLSVQTKTSIFQFCVLLQFHQKFPIIHSAWCSKG